MISNLDLYLTQFFTEYDCKIQEQAHGLLRVRLTEELDKELMNRPFYWHYMKSLGKKGEPKELILNTNPNNHADDAEWIHFGSPRLHQIWSYITKKEKYVLLFQKKAASQNTPLYPWLLTNIKISYRGKQTKEEIISLGIQLVSGKVVVNMMEELTNISLKQTISDFCFTISPIITIQSGYLRLEKIVLDYIKSQSIEWVDETKEVLNEELELLHHFYNENTEDVLFKKEIDEMMNRYKPEVKIEIINGGLLYLDEQF